MRLSKPDGSMACRRRSVSTRVASSPPRNSIYGPMPTTSRWTSVVETIRRSSSAARQPRAAARDQAAPKPDRVVLSRPTLIASPNQFRTTESFSIIGGNAPRAGKKAAFREKERASAWWRRGPELVEVLAYITQGDTSSVSSVPILNCAQRFKW
jgi:hypothetical protein